MLLTISSHRQSVHHRSYRRSGFTLISLLIVMVIAVSIFYFGFYRQSSELTKKQKESPDIYPWVEEWRIWDSRAPAPSDAVRQGPSSSQPVIDEDLQLSARVTLDGQQRGKLTLMFDPDGTVTGGWGGEYTTEERTNYLVMLADVSGNTDPSRSHRDEHGQEPSKLFFITKGNFMLVETQKNNRVRRVSGEMFVTGFIAPDFSVQGRLHLTTDRDSQKMFEWSGKARPPTGLLY